MTRGARTVPHDQIEVMFRSLRLEHFGHVLHYLAKVEVLGFDRQFAGFDF